MKVLIISPDILPVPAVKGGAVETLIEQLAKGSIDSQKLELSIVSIYDEKVIPSKFELSGKYYQIKKEFIPNVISRAGGRILRGLGSSRAYTNIYLGKIKSILKSNKFDYIVVENQPEYVLPIRKYTKAKIILHLHNDKLNRTTPLCDKITKSLDYVFTVSEYIKKCVLSIESVSEKTVKVLYNCVDLSKYSQSLTSGKIIDIKEEYDIPFDHKVLLFVGRIDKTKGILELLKAFNKISSKNITLVVAGGTWFSDDRKNSYTQQLEEEQRLSKNNIVFTGYIEHSVISDLQQSSDVLVVPSVWDDPCPLVVLESLASGTPLITTDSGGIPELVPGNCGIIVERGECDQDLINGLAKAIERVLCEEGLSTELTSNAKPHISWYTDVNYFFRFSQLIVELHRDKNSFSK